MIRPIERVEGLRASVLLYRLETLSSTQRLYLATLSNFMGRFLLQVGWVVGTSGTIVTAFGSYTRKVVVGLL